ncbi:hypothetical protein TcWFU_008463 [Taenia crassiceps]|uniref:Uncharacterized protein n=1 Tax=Taenia crassiceps TaxID=6207 RepID=A0ABR4Q8A3_9CEST
MALFERLVSCLQINFNRVPLNQHSTGSSSLPLQKQNCLINLLLHLYSLAFLVKNGLPRHWHNVRNGLACFDTKNYGGLGKGFIPKLLSRVSDVFLQT